MCTSTSAVTVQKSLNQAAASFPVAAMGYPGSDSNKQEKVSETAPPASVILLLAMGGHICIVGKPIVAICFHLECPMRGLIRIQWPLK